MNQKIKTLTKKINKTIEYILFCVSSAIILFILSQVFLFSSFTIPSDSMSPTLKPGDDILIFKPTIGARIFNVFTTLRNKQTTIHRLPGFKKIDRNDILVFNFPYPNNWEHIEMHILKYYVKRCIGLPGDTISIRGGIFHIKGFSGVLGNMTSQEEIGKIQSDNFNKEIFYCFPYDKQLHWSIKDFGPLYIPVSGDSISMNRQNFILYKELIEWEQKEKLLYRNDSIFLKNSHLKGYKFTKSYYFMAGDNSNNSKDSRYWGLLPEEYIVGKAWIIWKSKDPFTKEIRWKRIFRLIK